MGLRVKLADENGRTLGKYLNMEALQTSFAIRS